MDIEAKIYRCKVLSDSIARREERVRQEQAMMLREIAEMEQWSSRRSTVGQIGLLCSLTQAAAERKAALAAALTSYLPETLAAMDAGLIDEYGASRVFEATACASSEVASEVDARMAGKFSNRNAPALRRMVNSLLMRVDPDGYEERRKAKVAARRLENPARRPRILDPVRRTTLRPRAGDVRGLRSGRAREETPR